MVTIGIITDTTTDAMARITIVTAGIITAMTGIMGVIMVTIVDTTPTVAGIE